MKQNDITIQDLETHFNQFWDKATHDLTNSISAMKLALDNVQNSWPVLITSYQKAKEAGIKVDDLKSSLDHLSSQLALCHTKNNFNAWYLQLVRTKLTDLAELSIDMKVISMTTCLRKALKTFYPKYKLYNKNLIKDLLNQDFLVMGNETLVLHIFYNLLQNADYYLEKANKGVITITSSQDEKYNYLHFKDTAAGISDGDLPHIFEKFFTSTPGRMGLGLSFSKNAMEKMKGSIICQTKLSEYTEFVLSFPKL